MTNYVDKPLSGYGDEARGYYHSAVVTSPSAHADSWYMVQMRTGTLVVLVSIEIKSFDTSAVVSKDAMLKRAGPQTKAVTALVPKA
ncbi:hypothetical protein [Dactylosporangium darangshiense]|uniref:Uncharacterized protein n=1 Tax=Dactylosporangium darangshiense TaxID=579108 RepID=A0ABP8DPX1_9ACTN